MWKGSIAEGGVERQQKINTNHLSKKNFLGFWEAVNSVQVKLTNRSAQEKGKKQKGKRVWLTRIDLCYVTLGLTEDRGNRGYPINRTLALTVEEPTKNP